MDLRAADSATSLFQHPQGALGGWGLGLCPERGVSPLTGKAPPRATLTRHTLLPECRPGAWPLTQTVVRAIRGSWWVTEMTLEVTISATSSHGCCHLASAWPFIIKLSLV